MQQAILGIYVEYQILHAIHVYCIVSMDASIQLSQQIPPLCARIPAVMGNLGESWNLKFLFAGPGKVMENGKSGRGHRIVMEFHLYLQNFDKLCHFFPLSVMEIKSWKFYGIFVSQSCWNPDVYKMYMVLKSAIKAIQI